MVGSLSVGFPTRVMESLLEVGVYTGELMLCLECVQQAWREEFFNDWGGRGYDDSVLGEVNKTASSGDRTT